MSDVQIEFPRPCHYCGHDVDPNRRSTWHRVVGWERAGKAGGSDIVARQRVELFACNRCVDLVKNGHDPGQTSF